MYIDVILLRQRPISDRFCMYECNKKGLIAFLILLWLLKVCVQFDFFKLLVVKNIALLHQE